MDENKEKRDDRDVQETRDVQEPQSIQDPKDAQDAVRDSQDSPNDTQNDTQNDIQDAPDAQGGDGKKHRAHRTAHPVAPERKERRHRTLLYGGYSLITILVALAVLIAANFGMQKAEDRFGLKVDLTPNKQFSLSNEAKDYLKTVGKKIDLYTVYTNNTAANDLQLITKETMERLTSLNDNFTLGNIDVDRQPLEAKKFTEEGGTLARGSLIISNPENGRYRVLGTYDLVEVGTDQQSGSQYIAGYKIEQAVCNALVYVTSDKLNNLYFVEGHGEAAQYSFSTMESSWQGMNFEAKSLKLLEGGSELTAGDVVVLAAPTADCSEAERDVLKNFLANGGRMVYITDADKPALPNFESLLEFYGVGVSHDLVVEEDSNYFYQQQDVVMSPVSSGTHDVTKNFASRTGTMFYRSTSFTLPEMPKNSVVVTPLVQSSATSRQLNMTNPDANTAESAPTGAVPLAVSIEIKNPQGDTSLDGKIVAVGANCLDSQFLQMWPYNEYLFTGSLSWMRQADDTMYIAVKRPAASQLVFTSQNQMLGLAALVIIIIPLLVIVAGVVVWFRRRHL